MLYPRVPLPLWRTGIFTLLEGTENTLHVCKIDLAVF